jgi:hypothetical protein
MDGACASHEIYKRENLLGSGARHMIQPNNVEILEIVLMVAGLILLISYFCLLFELTHHFSFLYEPKLNEKN